MPATSKTIQITAYGGPEQMHMVELPVGEPGPGEIRIRHHARVADLGREGGHSKRRILHAKDVTGREIERALLDAVRASPNITLLEWHMGVDLITLSKFGGPDQCVGAYVLDEQAGQVKTILSRATVLATGGLSVPSTGSAGTGLRLAGALERRELTDLALALAHLGVVEQGLRMGVEGIVRGRYRRDPQANTAAADFLGHGVHDFEHQPGAVFDRAAVAVVAVVPLELPGLPVDQGDGIEAAEADIDVAVRQRAGQRRVVQPLRTERVCEVAAAALEPKLLLMPCFRGLRRCG